MRFHSSRVFPLALVALSACARSVTGTASVSGAIDSASFSSKVTAVNLTDETGKVAHAALNAAGQFHVYATSGHTYSLSVVAGGKTVPIDFLRAGGSRARTFSVNAMSLHASLGLVHEFHGLPVGGFPAVPQALPTCSQSGDQSGDQTGDHQGDHQDGSADNNHDQSGASEGDSNNNDNQNNEENGDGDFGLPDTSLPAKLGCGDGGDDESDGESSDDSSGD